MSQELKPCPFCGTQPEAATYTVNCINPWCEVQPEASGQSQAEAIAAWNRRSSPAPVGAVSPLPEPAAPSLDVEAMLRACVPGGSICDPQQVADTIRAYFAADVMACRAGDPTGRKGNCACKWGGGVPAEGQQ